MNRTALVFIAFLLAFTTQGYAQKSLKIGHVNMDSVAQLLPEVDSMRTAIEAKRMIQSKTLRIEEESFNNLYTAYSNNMEGMPAAWVEAKQEELLKKQQMIETLQRVDFPAELQEIQEMYLQKMYDKIMEAVKSIAQDQGYTYIFNSGEGLSGVLYAAPSEDITPVVIKKLNLNPAAVKTQQ
ncbi:MAG: OmpH family outer membrane protein [Bacteroidales bacterium]